MSITNWRLGVVSYLNSKPLIAGLDANPSIDMVFDVPAKLPELLDRGEVDCALVPVIDIMKPDRKWRIVSDACIGCDGETLTVRVFSRKPPDQIRRLHVDGDSHTSVVLANILWRELYGCELEIGPFTGRETIDECEAILLIGDKVVNNKLIDYDIQTDLGSSWKSLTSLPFVFAAWACQHDKELGNLGEMLSAARDLGMSSVHLIASDYAPTLGWPVALAQRYLTRRLKFTLGDKQREGMATFLSLAKKYDLVAQEQELVFA